MTSQYVVKGESVTPLDGIVTCWNGDVVGLPVKIVEIVG